MSNAFIFKDGEILAKDENANEETVNHTVNAFEAIKKRSDAILGIETATIQGANGRVNIASINDFYLTTVLSKKADKEYVNTLTRVLIPTVIKLVEKIHPASTDDETLTVEAEPAQEEVEEEADKTRDDENELAEEDTATAELAEEDTATAELAEEDTATA
ncbi:MAG: hypothetical protein JSW44_00475, partial [Candidatus Bathyarchaeota archaeon]